MFRLLSSLLVLALTAGGAAAAGLGDRCKTGANVAPEYLCPFGTLCFQSIGNKWSGPHRHFQPGDDLFQLRPAWGPTTMR